MTEDSRKRAKDEELLNGQHTDLRVGFVPLSGPVARCPWCGVVMVVVKHPDDNEDDEGLVVLCPECGILG